MGCIILNYPYAILPFTERLSPAIILRHNAPIRIDHDGTLWQNSPCPFWHRMHEQDIVITYLWSVFSFNPVSKSPLVNILDLCIFAHWPNKGARTCIYPFDHYVPLASSTNGLSTQYAGQIDKHEWKKKGSSCLSLTGVFLLGTEKNTSIIHGKFLIIQMSAYSCQWCLF